MRNTALQLGSRVATSLIALGAIAATAVAQTPVAHWTFDGYLNDYNQTTIYDIQTAGGTSDAIWADDNTDGLSYTQGKIGGAVRMGGTTNDFFRVDSIPEIANTIAFPDDGNVTIGTGMTLSAWVYSFGAGSSYQGVLMSRDVTDQLTTNPGTDEIEQNWGLAYRYGSQDFDGRLSNSGYYSPADSVPVAEWHHIAMVWGADQTTADDYFVPRRTYVDGVEVGFTQDTGVAKIISSGEWLIGSDLGRQFNGLLDDLAIYGSALTGSQVAAITSAGNAGTNASGVATTSILEGDVDGSGTVNMTDFNIIRDNLTKTVSARNLGDLNGDRKVGLDDFQEWLNVAPAAMRSEALASFGGTAVPEPASCVLLGLTIATGLLVVRRAPRGVKRTNLATAAILVLAGSLFATQANAQQLKLLVDRETGNLSLTGDDELVVDFAGYSIRSQRGTLVDSNWNGMRDTETNWVDMGISSSTIVSEANSIGGTAGAVVNDSLAFDLGNAYDASTASSGLALGTDVESADLSLAYYDQIANAQLPGIVEFVGEKIYNDIIITVDLADGRAYLENESPNNLTITGYTIESAAGLLSTTTSYTGLGGSFQMGPAVRDGNGLGEIDPTESGQLLASSTAFNTTGIDLGVIINTSEYPLASVENDLTFSFLLDQQSRTGSVKYINVPVILPGDFNGDLTVDLADYTVWRNNLGAATDLPLNGAGDGNQGVDVNDYNVWKANFGNSAAGSVSATMNSATVPEPGSLALSAMGALAVVVAGGWCRRSAR